MQSIIGKHWHHLPDAEVEELLDTSRLSGLDLFEIEHRTLRFGPNVIPAKKKMPAIVLFLKQFHQPLVYILLAAALVTALLSEVVDASVIFGVVLVNALIGFIQEANAVKAIEALSRAMVADATVIRAGETRKISSPGVVPGDVVVLQAGDKVPADVRLFAVRDLQVDESALTGESVPVEKKTGVLPPGTLLPERANMAYASTMVTYGQGRGIVVATGETTEVGVISRLVSSVPLLETPLTRRISSFSRVLLYAILAMAAVTFAVGYLRGEPAMEMFMAAVALAVGAIPEGLPAALTITLAIGVSRMAKKRAVIRSLPAVETLGSTTVICSDKTGTLTENRMTVQEIMAGGRQYTVTGTGYGSDGEVREDGRAVPPGPALTELLTAGVLCNDSSLAMGGDGPVLQGDPTEGALIAAAAKAGVNKKAAEKRLPRLDSIPFQSEYQYMATLHRDPGSGRQHVYAKGAAEKLVAMCSACMGEEGTPEPLDRETVTWLVRDMSQRGLRVLGFARFEHGDGGDRIGPGSLAGDGIFLGLQAMIDPPRTESAEAVAKCRRAGITVKMITGDHPLTARAIALKIGIIDDGGTAGRP